MRSVHAPRCTAWIAVIWAAMPVRTGLKTGRGDIPQRDEDWRMGETRPTARLPRDASNADEPPLFHVEQRIRRPEQAEVAIQRRHDQLGTQALYPVDESIQPILVELG